MTPTTTETPKPPTVTPKKKRAEKKAALIAEFKAETAARIEKDADAAVAHIVERDTADAEQVRPFITKFRDAHERTIASILDMADTLLAARKAIKHGAWSRVFKDSSNPLPEIPGDNPGNGALSFGITLDTAERLMALRKQKAFSNSVLSRNIPPSPSAMYELARLSPSELEKAVKSGEVTAETTVRQARALVAELYPEKSSDGSRFKDPGPGVPVQFEGQEPPKKVVMSDDPLPAHFTANRNPEPRKDGTPDRRFLVNTMKEKAAAEAKPAPVAVVVTEPAALTPEAEQGWTVPFPPLADEPKKRDEIAEMVKIIREDREEVADMFGCWHDSEPDREELRIWDKIAKKHPGEFKDFITRVQLAYTELADSLEKIREESAG